MNVDESIISGTDQWQHLKTLTAAPAGTFADETFMTTLTVPSTGLAPVPHTKRLSSRPLEQIHLWVIALNASGAILTRGSPEMTWTMRGIYVVHGRHDVYLPQDTAPYFTGDTLIDSVPTSTNVTLNRELRIPVRGQGRFTTQFEGFMNVPALATELLVFWRAE